jgi:hypothetical protein
MDDEPISEALDSFDRCVELEHATAQLGVLPRLHVASSHAGQGMGIDRQLCLSGRGEHDPARPWQQPSGQLEATVLLANDEQALARVGVCGTCADVVRDVFVAGRVGHPRLGNADREDRGATAVVAFTGMKLVPITVP